MSENNPVAAQAISEKDKSEKKEKKSSSKKKSSKKKNSTALPGTDKKYIRTIRILAFLIPFVAVLIGMLAGSFAPFGSKDVMTSGGMEKTLTYYYELYDRVHDGGSLSLSLTSGTGTDFSSVFTWFLSDPLNLIILIFPRTAILSVLNLLFAVKIGLCGLFMSIFLTRRKARILARKEAMESRRADIIELLQEKARLKKEKAKEKASAKGGKAKKDFKIGGSEAPHSGIGTFFSLLDLPNLGFSIAFALSTYMFGQGLNVTHLTAVALFPLILMALDNLLENGSWRMYAGLMTASIFCSLHITIIIFIFSILYTAVYDYSDIHHALRNVLLKLLSDLLAAGAGAVILLTSVGSSFFQNSISYKFPDGAPSTTAFDAIKALLTGTGSSLTLRYGYGIDVFCGILTVFLVILYVMNPNISLRRRLSQSGLLLALFTGLFIVTPNYFFNGFFGTHANVVIFGFLFVFQMVSMAYEEFLNLKHSAPWQLHLSAGIVTGLIMASLFLCDNYDVAQPFLYAIEFLFIYYVLFAIYRTGSMTKRLFLTLVPLVLIGEMLFTGVDDLRGVGSHSGKYEDSKESLLYEEARRIKRDEPEARILCYDPEESMSTPVTNSLLGYDYVITPTEVTNVDTLLTLKKKSAQGVSIYENPYSTKGFFLPKAVETWNYDAAYPFSSLSRLSTDLLGTGEFFMPANGTFNIDTMMVFDDNSIEEKRNYDYSFKFVPDSTGDIYGNIFNIYHFGEREEGKSAIYTRRINTRESYDNTLNVNYAYFDSEKYLEFYNKLVKADYTQTGSNSFSFKINAPEDGYLVLPLTKLTGWSVTGGNVSCFSLNEDYLMVSVTKGDNEVTARFTPTLFYIGMVISFLILALLILLSVKDLIRIPSNAKAVNVVATFLRTNYVYVLTFAITTLIFIIMQWYTASTPFGNNSILIGDGYSQTYNDYRGLLNDVKNGSFSIVNWNTGIAIDRYTTFSGYMLTPWNILKMYVLPESMAFFDLAITYFISFVTPGLYLILYLTHKRRGPRMKKNDWRLIVVGTAYSLSSFCISYFVYGNFSLLIYLPLILLGLERLVYDRKPALYIILLFSYMGDPYYAFMLCEFLFLYFFTMEFDSIKDFFMKGIRFALSSIAAACLACFKLIPYFWRILDSPYKALDSASPVEQANGSYLSLATDTMAFRQPNVVTANDYKANIYIGLLVLFFVPLYILNKKVPLSVRIRRMFLVVLFFVGFGNSTLNYIFHGLHYQNKVPNRFAAFYVFLMLVMFYECVSTWKDISAKKTAISIAGSSLIMSGIWIYAYITEQIDMSLIYNGNEMEITFYGTMIFAVLYLTFALLQLIRKHKEMFRKLMLAFCLLELCCSALVTFKLSMGLHVINSDDDIMINRLAERNSDMTEAFHATEYIGAKYYNTASFTNITSISAFSSYMSSAHMDLMHKWGILTSSNNILYQSGNPLADMMLHVQYHLSNDNLDTSWSHYPIVDHEGYMELHENPNYLPVGIYMPNSADLQYWNASDYSAYNENCFEYHNAFSRIFGCGDIFHEIDPELDESKITEENKPHLNYITADSTDYEAGISNEVPVWVHVSEEMEGDIYLTYFGSVVYLGTTVKGEADEFEMTMYLPQTDKKYYIRIATADYDELSKLHAKLAEHTMEDAKISGSSFTGTINAPEDGMIYLSIPNMKEWKYTVDGNSAEPVTYLGGVGLAASAGTHTITVKYTPQGMWIGILISAATAVILIGIGVAVSVRKKKKRAED